ncbi:hypothetical protein QBC46DRAFT_384714 [Diplogelasinospora grovesii]|uniref:Transcription initiation factor IIF subunit alpha n=1 Tax=Diplogelasinospora grovesii TaxID=303347 RepID=A0AAN6N7N2_9PEZI|nr:hypothetical protein QBC46DRAFT_384714 [Diplogelasinospora grovesii]
MSDHPSIAPNGPKAPPAGAPLPRRRPKPKVDPLVARKKKPIPKPTLWKPTALTKGVPESGIDQPPPSKLAVAKMTFEEQGKAKLRQIEAKRAQNGGWSEKPPAACAEFPLVTTKRAIMENIRYHVMRLNRGRGDAPLDVTNQDQFPRPVTLHRRDPRAPPAHRMMIKEELDSANPADEAEAERLRQEKADREAQRASDLAQIAPVSKPNEPKKQQNSKKEKASSYYGRHSEAQVKQSGLRYEETLPWHLEDADGKAGVWVGSYIAGLSDVNCALVIDGASFRMIPVERYYRFDEKPRFDTLSLDDAENLMSKTRDVKRWVMIDREKQASEKEKDETRQFLRGRPRVKMESVTSRMAPKTERQDDFELDVSGDEFQDDDETPGFEADDEDSKESKDRLRRDHLGANLFGDAEEDKVEQEAREEELDKLKRKTIGKETVKKLMKLEHAMDYDTDSEEDEKNPFTDSSESESESEEKKDEAKKEEDAKKPGDSKDQTASGSNTKGNTTPSGRQKTTDLLKKGNKLKRPGSPNQSETSADESSRKKLKTGKATASMVPSRSGTPLPGRPKGAVGGATSDGEATGGEGSDGGLKLKKKIKLKPNSIGSGANGTPVGSRASSPNPPNNQGLSPTKLDSSNTPRESPAPASISGAPKIELWEIVDLLAAQDGITLGNLMRKFNGRVDAAGNVTKGEWIQMVRQVANMSPDKLMRPKPGVTTMYPKPPGM